MAGVQVAHRGDEGDGELFREPGSQFGNGVDDVHGNLSVRGRWGVIRSEILWNHR